MTLDQYLQQIRERLVIDRSELRNLLAIVQIYKDALFLSKIHSENMQNHLVADIIKNAEAKAEGLMK